MQTKLNTFHKFNDYIQTYLEPERFPQVRNALIELVENANILVTGAQGMLGASIMKYLIYASNEGLIHPNKLFFASRSWKLHEKVQNQPKVSLIANSEISNCINQINVLIHTASPSNITKVKSLEELLSINTSIFRSINMSEIRKIVFISSGEVYGALSPNEDQEIPVFDLSLKRNWYPASKMAGEKLLSEFPASIATSIRLFHTFGPGVKEDDGRSFADFLWAGARGKDIVLKSSGSQERSYLYIPDAVEGIFRIIELSNNDEPIFNLGSEKKQTVLSFAEMVSQKTNTNLRFEVTDEFEHSPNHILIPNTAKLKSIGWNANYDWSFAMDKTLEWIRNSFREELAR